MRITKFGHSCVRIEYDGRALVIDPGMFTDPGAVEGAAAILITHEHNDHWDADLLRESNAPIHTIAEVAAKIRAEAPDVGERITVLEPGSSFEAALPVRAVGELHAVIHPEYPRVHNSGFLVTAGDKLVYHPGDSLLAPGETIDVLCAPASAPWLKASEAINFVREVKAPTNLSIHDRVYSEAGHDMLERHMTHFLSRTGQQWVRLDDGADL